MTPEEFWLGAHHPHWLGLTPVPLMVSDARMRNRKTLPERATDGQGYPGPLVVDSGGFRELQDRGEWTVTPAEYAARLPRYRDEIGGLVWSAPQDLMCEPQIIDGGWYGDQYFVGTHRGVFAHQVDTVLNYARLIELLNDEIWVPPSVQGWKEDEYERCLDLYDRLIGVDLTTEPLILVGSLCRRQNTAEAGRILRRLRRCGLRNMHGLGFKLDGVEQHGGLLHSTDSAAWSRGARWGDDDDKRLPGCTHRGRKHANCLPYALWWRENRVLPAIRRGAHAAAQGEQGELFDLATTPAGSSRRSDAEPGGAATRSLVASGSRYIQADLFEVAA